MNYSPLHLDPGEEVILEVRKHWIVFVEFALGLLMSACLPFILFVVIKIFTPVVLTFEFPGNGYALFTFFYVLWLLIIWVAFFVNWTKYYLDVWFVTKKRIIIIDQRRIFDREVSNIRFDKIQDVTVEVRGVIATFLDFGNVRVQTASEDSREFSIRTVRHPDKVKKVIFDQHNVVGDKIGGKHV